MGSGCLFVNWLWAAILLLLLMRPEVECSKKLLRKMQLWQAQEAEQKQLSQDSAESLGSRPDATLDTGFFIGKAVLDSFEYVELDGVMTPLEAVRLCEEDLACGGFTYRGGLGARSVPVKVYFVSLLAAIKRKAFDDLIWTSYRAKRPLVVIPGRRLVYPGDGQLAPEGPSEILFKEAVVARNRSQLARMVWPFANTTVAMSFKQNRQEDFRLFLSYDLTEHDLSDVSYLTVLNSLSREALRRLSDTKPKLHTQCAEHREPLVLKHFFDPKWDDNIDTVSCSLSPKLFLSEYVMKQRPVKLVGCISPLFNPVSLDHILSKGPGLSWSGHYTQNNITLKAEQLSSAEVRNLRHTLMQMETSSQRSEDLKTALHPLDVSLPLPQDLLPDDLKPVDAQQLKFQSSTLGTTLTRDKDSLCRHSSLLSGHRWWLIFDPDVWSQDEVELQCVGIETGPLTDHVKSWFSDMYPQLTRRTVRGTRATVTVQRPGETIYIPGHAAFAFYNLDDVLEYAGRFLSLSSVQYIPINESLNDQQRERILEHVNNDDIRTILEGIQMQIQEAGKDELWHNIVLKNIMRSV